MFIFDLSEKCLPNKTKALLHATLYAHILIMIQTSFVVDNESDDELSTGAAVAISIVVTFIITLVVTALITYIITHLYYKNLIDHMRKSVTSQGGDSHSLKEDIKRHDSARAATVTMNPNPAYGTASTIKMDTNPAYAITN